MHNSTNPNSSRDLECIAAALQKPQNPDCLRLNQVLIRRPGSSLAWKLPVGAANRPTRHRARARRPGGVAWRVPSVPGEPSPPGAEKGVAGGKEAILAQRCATSSHSPTGMNQLPARRDHCRSSGGHEESGGPAGLTARRTPRPDTRACTYCRHARINLDDNIWQPRDALACSSMDSRGVNS